MKKFLMIFIFSLMALFLVSCDNGDDKAIDLSGVVFKSIEVEYDKNEVHSIKCENLPEGVYDAYLGNGVTEPGKYKVTAILTDANDNELKTLVAYITVLAPEVEDEPTEVPTGSEDEDNEVEYYIEIGGNTYDLYYDEDADSYYVDETITVYSDEDIFLYDVDYEILDGVTDGRENGASANNAILTENGLKVYATADDVEVTVKLVGGSYVVTLTGNDEVISSVNGGQSNEPDYTCKYNLVINGQMHYGLTSNGKVWVDEVEHDEYFITGVQLNAGDVVTMLDTENNATWAITNVNPYSIGSFSASSSGIIVGETGTYDIYVQFAWENDKIYFGPAA